MTRYPETRDECRASILAKVYQLVQAVESDINEHGNAEFVARQLEYDVREYFKLDRWKPTPINDGLKARVPLNQPVTLEIIHHRESADGRRLVQGTLTEIGNQYRPADGARFMIIPRRCRNPRTHWYRASAGTAIRIWRGYVEEGQLDSTPTLYELEIAEPIPYPPTP